MVAALTTATADSSHLRWTANAQPAGMPISRPFTLFGQIANDWVIATPLPMILERGDDGIIISDDVFALYGIGNSPAEALQDYLLALIEYHELLSAHTDEPTMRLYAHLQKYLQRK